MKFDWVIDCECGAQVPCGWSSVKMDGESIYLECACGHKFTDVEVLKTRGRFVQTGDGPEGRRNYCLPFWSCEKPKLHSLSIVLPGADKPTTAK